MGYTPTKQTRAAGTTFGAHLRRLRAEYGQSQTALADAANINSSYISRLESGDRQPTRDAIAAIATGCDLGPDERDALLIAGGFLPGDTGIFLADEPELRAVYRLLRGLDGDDPTRLVLVGLLQRVIDLGRTMTPVDVDRAAD